MDTKGFSLLEVIVAVSILIIGIIAIVSLILQSTRASDILPTRATALALAEEALEVVRNEVESDFLNGDPFNDYQTSPDCSGAQDCIIGYDPSCITAACDGFDTTACNPAPPLSVIGTPGSDFTRVKFHENLGYYSLPNAFSCWQQDENYFRKFEVTKPTLDDDVIQVTVTVWTPGNAQTIILSEFITNPRAIP